MENGKACPRCEKTYSPDDYGRSWCCKACKRKEVQEYNKTPQGRAASAWRLMNRRVKTQPEYAGVEVRMTREEFMQWAIPEYENWNNDTGIPTVDRTEPDGHYELSNLQLLEWGENSRRNRRNKNVYAPPGMAWCGTCKEYLPEDRFGKSARSFNGLASVCKECRKGSLARTVNPRWKNPFAEPGQQWCSACQEYLNESEFYVSRTAPGGFQSSCKKCQNSGKNRKS